MIRLLFILLFSPTFLPAQSNFLKDPDIVWAAEIEQDWVIDIPSFEDEWQKGIITLKQFRTGYNQLHYSSPYLADLVFEAIESGDLNVFKDPDCKVKTNIEAAFPGADTIITFDPVTYEEHMVEVFNQPRPLSDVKAWRLRQVLAYHKKSASWSTRVIGIAPLIDVRKRLKDSVELQPLFWFKPDNKRHNLHSNRIPWAKKTVSGKQPSTEIPPYLPKPVKAMNGFENPISHLLRVFETDMKSPFYNSQGDKLLSPKERKKMLPRSDTIASYDLVTSEETITIEPKGITENIIYQLRLVQTWYWDKRRARLSICLDAVAPMKGYFNDFGDFMYSRPLFYRKAKQ